VNPIVSTVLRKLFKHKRAFALLCFFFTVIGTTGAVAFFDREPILFQSRESKSEDNGPVFNRIAYIAGGDKDVWMMQQGHQGNDGAFTSWDRIAIVVKHDRVRSTTFHQLIPGDLSFDIKSEAPKRAACFACHPNGPRVIRPEFSDFEVSGWNRMRLFLWNLRIKSYGPLSSESQGADPTFRLQIGIANDALKVKACTRCHNDSHILGRGELTRQNFPVIDFMLKEGLMPPPGYKVSEHERREVLEFIGR
jgi:hypothetical protein